MEYIYNTYGGGERNVSNKESLNKFQLKKRVWNPSTGDVYKRNKF